MARYRHIARTVALQTLVSLLLRDESSDEGAEKVFAHVKREFAPELRRQDDFARELVKGVLDRRAVIDPKIQEFAPEWPLEKLSAVERVILEVGVFELMFHLQTPLGVIANEWVELAKEFGDETAGKFVNGVLSTLGHSVRGENGKK